MRTYIHRPIPPSVPPHICIITHLPPPDPTGAHNPTPAQICKNVVLAGINVALLDHAVVTGRDLNAQFYLRPEDVGKNVSTCVCMYMGMCMHACVCLCLPPFGVVLWTFGVGDWSLGRRWTGTGRADHATDL